jgi:RNA polymerase sigma-70 factor (ECF subfamily)
MDTDTFESHCAEARPAILAYAYTCARDLTVAEDIAQETLLIAFKKRDQYFPEADFKGWLISIARNVWFRERDRRQMADRTTRLIEENAALWFSQENYSEERWERERRALAGCLQKLGDADRQIIHAHFTQNHGYLQISESMKRSLSWVKVRMFRARTTLHQCVRLTLERESREGF